MNVKAATKIGSRHQPAEDLTVRGGALAVSCLAMGMILGTFVLANNLLHHISFSMGVTLLGLMSACPLMAWHTLGRHKSLETSVFTSKAHWQVRVVAMLWVIYTFMLLMVVQQFLIAK